MEDNNTPKTIVQFLSDLGTAGWISLLNKLLVNAPCQIPISMEKSLPEEVISELSTIMNENRVDKGPLEEATLSLLFALRGEQSVPYKINTIVNIVSILRPVYFNSQIQELILTKSFIRVYFNSRNIHLSLLNYYRTVIAVEDLDVSIHLETLLDSWTDSNLYLVAARYFKRFTKSEQAFFDRLLQIITATTGKKDGVASLVIFLEEWGRNETYRPFCKFLDITLWNHNNISGVRNFVDLSKNFLAKITDKSVDIYCLQALNLCKAFLDQEINQAEIDYLIKYQESRNRDMRSLIRLNTETLPQQINTRLDRFFRMQATARQVFKGLEKRFGSIYRKADKDPDTSIVGNFTSVDQYDKVQTATEIITAKILEVADVEN